MNPVLIKERGEIMRKFVLGYAIIMSMLILNIIKLQTVVAQDSDNFQQKAKITLNEKEIIKALSWIEIPSNDKKKEAKYYITSPQKREDLEPGQSIKIKVEFANPQGGVLSQKNTEKSIFMIADAVVNCKKGYLDIFETSGYNVNLEKTFTDTTKRRYGEDSFFITRELLNENQDINAVYKQACFAEELVKNKF